MNKRRRILLLALPLVLGALLGGAKWKQMHPTATEWDLQERAYLSKASEIKIWQPTFRGHIPVAEFKKALNDFYLLDTDPSDINYNSTPLRAHPFLWLEISSHEGIKHMATIRVSPSADYSSLREFGFGQTQILTHYIR